jgi:hypothetical protein
MCNGVLESNFWVATIHYIISIAAHSFFPTCANLFRAILVICFLLLDFSIASMICRCSSIDGDADRVVFFTHIDGVLTLLDGDRIAVLAALLVNSLAASLTSKHAVSVSLFLGFPPVFPPAQLQGFLGMRVYTLEIPQISRYMDSNTPRGSWD